ncbi:MAG: DUF503 domain-containing protein [Acidimicrobiales bacterium]
MELVLDASHSLKDKRSVVKHLVEATRRRYAVSSAEVGHQDEWGRSTIGFAAIAADVRHVEDVLDKVERFVWSHPEIEVTSSSRYWVDCSD